MTFVILSAADAISGSALPGSVTLSDAVSLSG
jgi:hypothetical protein